MRIWTLFVRKRLSCLRGPCRLGAVVSECSDAEEEALSAYGSNLGVAFQLVDDILDYNADESELGKTVGDDFREGKVTLPILLGVGTWHRRRPCIPGVVPLLI